MEKSENIEKVAHIRGLEDSFSSRMGSSKQIFSKEKGTDINTLYNVLKASPEVTACVTAVIEDIMADEWKFVGSSSAKGKAETFSSNSNFFKVLSNALLDLLTTGDAYILKLAVNEEKVKSLMSRLTTKVAKELNITLNKKIVYDLIEQETKIPKDLQLLKASTIKINYDETGKVLSYEQQVGLQSKRVYRPEDVIHLSLLNIGGQPYGFTSLETALSDVATLIFAKEFAGKYFENDGIPYFIFHMPDATPDDRNYKNLVQELKNMKKEANKYRSMVITGNVTAEQVNKFNKDMEFAKLIQHFTQLILVTMGVPAHRINLTIDVRQVGGAVNRAYEGYYKKISFMQKIIENALNPELWKPFVVEMKFNRAYKIDEMREAQVVQILTQAGLVTVEEAREMMGMEPQMPSGTMPIATSPTFGNAETDVNQRNQSKDENKPKETIDNRLKSIQKKVELENFQSKLKEIEDLTILSVKEKDAEMKILKEQLDKAKVELEQSKLQSTNEISTIKNNLTLEKENEVKNFTEKMGALKTELNSTKDKLNEIAALKEDIVKAKELETNLLKEQINNSEKTIAELREAQITSYKSIIAEKMLNEQNSKNKSDDIVEIGYVDFVKIVENVAGAGQFDKACVLYIETKEQFIMFFNDGSWRYKCFVNKKEVNEKRFKLEKLRNAVKIL